MLQVQISERAQSKIGSLLKEDQEKKVKILFKGIGWKGSTLELALEESKEDEVVIKVDGIELYFKKLDKLYIHKSSIDYCEEYPGNGFKVTPWFDGFWLIKGGTVSEKNHKKAK